MAAKANRTRNEPLDNEPTTPEGEAAMPGSISMIKWKIYRSPAITIGVVMVKSVVYYYELRIYVLAVWHSPDGSGICSPYTGDRGP